MSKTENPYKCTCDCDCPRLNDRESDQCDYCDNGTHYDPLRNIFVDYELEQSLR